MTATSTKATSATTSSCSATRNVPTGGMNAKVNAVAAASATPTAAAMPPTMAATRTGSTSKSAGVARVRCDRNGSNASVQTATPARPTPKPTRLRRASNALPGLRR